ASDQHDSSLVPPRYVLQRSSAGSSKMPGGAGDAAVDVVAPRAAPGSAIPASTGTTPSPASRGKTPRPGGRGPPARVAAPSGSQVHPPASQRRTRSAPSATPG